MTGERVGREHFEAILQLQQEHYPEAFRTPVERLHDRLGFIEDTPPFFSWALTEDTQLTAYMFAFHAYTSLSSQGRELVVSVDDLIIEPGRPMDLFRLLALLKDSMSEAELDGLPVEATCRRGAYQILSKHPRAVERLGYELVAENVFWVPELDEELTWMRFHPIGAASIDIQDRNSWSEELREEVLARRRKVT